MTVIPPPLPPYKSYISGVSISEASSGNIKIGAPVSRLVEKLLVEVGAKVKKGDVLYRLEDLDLQANLIAAKASYDSARVKLQRLEDLPRPQDLEISKAAVNIAKAEFEFAKSQYEMVQKLPDQRLISQDEKDRRIYNYRQAEAKYQQAQADEEKTKAGTWEPDLTIAAYEVLEAEANAKRIDSDIQRTIIKSPLDGTVLQIKVRAGEFPPADSLSMPMMIVGNIDEIYLRVSINQLDTPYFKSGASAEAFLQDNANVKFPLEFVRVEPLLVNKQDYTNEITEKAETRVLQILYKMKKENTHRIFIGQQFDVFIEAEHP